MLAAWTYTDKRNDYFDCGSDSPTPLASLRQFLLREADRFQPRAVATVEASCRPAGLLDGTGDHRTAYSSFLLVLRCDRSVACLCDSGVVDGYYHTP
jgi:hypothetical protein